jgi:protease-4
VPRSFRDRPLLAGGLLIGGLVVACLLAVALVARGAGGLGGAGRVAVVDVTGVIVDSEDVVRDLRRHASNPAVKAIVLRVDSPGGGVGPSQEIYEEVRRTRDRGKRVVASMGAVAASGGLLVSLAADRIVANEGTITGSIGVIIQFLNLEGLGEKVGVRAVVVKSGQFKDIGSPARPMTDEDRRVIQGVVDDVYEQFVQAIVADRKLPEADVRRFADGRVFSGRQAKTLGLVDATGNLWTAIHEAATLANIPGEPTVIFPEEPSVSILDLLRGRLPLDLGSALLDRLAPRGFLAPTLQVQYLLTP